MEPVFPMDFGFPAAPPIPKSLSMTPINAGGVANPKVS